jgi:hypothetical protein
VAGVDSQGNRYCAIFFGVNLDLYIDKHSTSPFGIQSYVKHFFTSFSTNPKVKMSEIEIGKYKTVTNFSYSISII